MEKKPLRVCLLTQFFHPDASGSSPTFISELVHKMVQDDPGLQVDVITSRRMYREHGRLAREEVWDGIHIQRTGLPTGQGHSMAIRLMAGILFTLAGMVRILLRPKYDLVFVTTNPPPSPMAAWVIRKVKRTPYVYLIWDLYPDVPARLGMLRPGSPIHRITRILQRAWLHSAQKVIVIGRCCQDYVHREYQVPLARIPVVPHWADPGLYTPDQPSRFALKHGLTGFHVLYAGNIGHAQDLGIVLDAAARMKEEHSNLHFLLVGNGAGVSAICKRIEGARLENVTLFQSVARVEYPDLLAAAGACLVSLAPDLDGLAVPSKFYGLLAAGKPVIALVPLSCEIARVIKETDCGIQVTPGDLDGLIAALGLLRDHPEIRARMGRNARQALESAYTLPVLAGRFRALLGGAG